MTADRPADLGFIDLVHRSRVAVGGVLFAVAVGCVIAAGWCGYTGFKDSFAERPADAAKPPPADPAKKAADGDAGKMLDPVPWRWGMAAAVLAALGAGAGGAYFVGRVPDADAAGRRRADRILLLAVGYVFGLANRLCGLILFLCWFDKLADWVDGKENSQKFGWWPVAALLQFLLGAGVTFLAALPARAEERNRPWVRRAVYAINFALSGALMVVALVLVNAVVAMQAPAKLDTTATGFYTLTEQTKGYLTGLRKTIKVYVLNGNLGGEDKLVQDDIARLVAACRQVNPARIQVEVLSAAGNQATIQDLKQKYKSADLNTYGVLLASEQDPERYEHVPLRRLGRQNPQGKMSFVGEAQLVSAMMALTEERTTVYYTRGSGELGIDRPADPNAPALARPAFRLQDALTATQCEARPLVIDPFSADPKVPADAALVMVLDPLTPLPPATVTAIQRYLTNPRPGGQRGKLLVFAAPHNAPAGRVVAKTGLEPVLAELGVDLGDRVINTQPANPTVPPDVVVIAPTQAAVKQRNPMAQAAAAGLIVQGTRPVDLAATGGRGGAQPLMGVATSEYTWLEKGVYDPPQRALVDMIAATQRRDADYQRERDLSNQTPRPVAATVTDPEGKPTAAVFGFADGLSDDAAAADGGQTTGVFKAALGWLRERPPAPEITAKEYVEYVPNKKVTDTRLVWVPFAGMLAAIALLGLGVWAVRRK